MFIALTANIYTIYSVASKKENIAKVVTAKAVTAGTLRTAGAIEESLSQNKHSFHALIGGDVLCLERAVQSV